MITISIELDILKNVCCQLEAHAIPYMLTGSFAANFYAIPRMTRDLDIVIDIRILDTNRIYQIFRQNFYIEKHRSMKQ